MRNVKNVAAILVLLALIGGVLYGTLSGSREADGTQSRSTSDNSTSMNGQALPDYGEKTTAPQAEIGVKEGNKAPDFSLETLDGKTMRLSDFRGKTVIMNIWATWCLPCRKEIPDMVAFYEKARKENIEILAVNLTETESSIPNVKRFVEGMKMQFPILLDKKSKVAHQYQTTIIPSSFVIDSNGIIRKVVLGPMTKEKMRVVVKGGHVPVK
ncbi:peroxiredoxin family protein [Aneurinibacillus aneurinilyticus]|jgi:peroxiredoxin|uniref:Thiol-disulfide oxidoreductase ResA domain protein n=1 Tax=Aneurinibacillus aneurinilyticus ATCC 12856 TaxID=649747 RepID=U1YA25_ANEAE|nr:redoxin domain-containing protein [Aneurinibacillus aneurinilyticus]ERI07666.1 thiol-disulfide oxidoreductase ResA domain protein [Aneurinibacillus aneurinilyticus ATCC 12856]MCI1692828.1 redoxin domain-containing protein [Aneurinibacillus aneurinilyticus]MED0708270.1 redoxin domain-containing protein [Aneurinibacillus aneurinilyticus]MED0726371.1 redoxin domain-containing protein [Aneurinibacillus aneurinilyticus]MED0732367.1 redoxin domain-containing protein [Aneurinibacillus aneurinilyti